MVEQGLSHLTFHMSAIFSRRSHSVRIRGIGEAAVEGWININKALLHDGKVDSTGDELLEPAGLGVGGTEEEL